MLSNVKGAHAIAIMMVSIGGVLLGGCRPPKAPEDAYEECFQSLETSPDRYDTSSFYVTFACYGGQTQDLYRVLFVTTDPNLFGPAGPQLIQGTVVPLEQEPKEKPWKEVYHVGEKTANEIAKAVDKAGFFKRKSMPDAAKYDGITFSMLAKTGSGRHRAIVSLDCDFTLDDYRAIEAGTFDPGTSKIKAHVSRFFEVVAYIRTIAARDGELLREMSNRPG